MKSLNYLINRTQRHQKILEHFIKENHELIEQTVNKMVETYENRGKFVFVGNGGSAADSQHAAAEFLGRFKKDRKPIAAISLTTDTSTITAISNDYSYEDVFSRQIQVLVKPEDLVFLITTSGNSRNIIKGFKECFCNTVVLTGGNGGEIKTLIDKYKDINLNVELADGSAEVQEVHIFILHSLIDLFEKRLEEMHYI